MTFPLPARFVVAAARAAALALPVAVMGCVELSEIEPRPLTSDARLDAREVEELSRLSYPADAPRGRDLDIVVVQGNVAVELVNRTASRFRNVRVWINEQYVAPEMDLDVGRGNRVDLRRFVNALEEPFPVGTVLAPDAGRPVVLAELHDPGLGLRHRLIVQHNDDADLADARRSR